MKGNWPRFLATFLAPFVFCGCQQNDTDANECEPNMEKCEGNAYLCNESNQWEIKEVCTDSQFCAVQQHLAFCQEYGGCTAGDEKCQGGDAFKCNDNQTWSLKQDCPGDQACVLDGGEASCDNTNDCEEGTPACRNGDAYQCDANGDWFIIDECIGQQVCIFENGLASCREQSQPDVIAEDGFEHGKDWEWFSGSGWEWHLWIHNGKDDVTNVVTDGQPHGGSRHARLRGGPGTNKGYLSRKVHLMNATQVRLQFWWKASGFESGESVDVKVFDGSWHTILTIGSGQDDDTYHYEDIDLSQYNMVARFYINFEAANLNDDDDLFYIDDVQVTGNRPAHSLPWDKELWAPSPYDSWDWTITGEIDTSFDVVMYDIDWEDAPQHVVDTLKGQGRKLACYIDVGTAENWRSDYDAFPGEVQGLHINPPWSDQFWLDARRLDILMPIMIERFKVCKEKGFDMTQYDDLQGWDPESEPDGTGFPLTEQDIIDFTVLLADESKSMGMGAAFENNYNSTEELEPFTDWFIIEEGARWSENQYTDPYRNAGKAVFAAEYTDNDFGDDPSEYCDEYNALNIRCIQKHRFLFSNPRFDCADY